MVSWRRPMILQHNIPQRQRCETLSFFCALPLLIAAAWSQSSVPTIFVFQSDSERALLTGPSFWNINDDLQKSIFLSFGSSDAGNPQQYAVVSFPLYGPHHGKLRLLNSIDSVRRCFHEGPQAIITVHHSSSIEQIADKPYIRFIQKALEEKDVHPSQLRLFILAKNDLWPLDTQGVRFPEMYDEDWLQVINELQRREFQRAFQYQSLQMVEYLLARQTFPFRHQPGHICWNIQAVLIAFHNNPLESGVNTSYQQVQISWERISFLWSFFDNMHHPFAPVKEFDECEEISLRMFLLHLIEDNEWEKIQQSLADRVWVESDVRCLVALVAAVKQNDIRSVQALLQLYKRGIVRMRRHHNVALVVIALLFGHVSMAQVLMQHVDGSMKINLNEFMTAHTMPPLLCSVVHAVLSGFTNAVTLVRIVSGDKHVQQDIGQPNHEALHFYFKGLQHIMRNL